MKKIFIVCFTLLVSICYAQKKPKIQGNKIVVDVYNTLEDFDSIEISDDLEVTITQTESNGYHIKTDENLVAIVKFEIVNGSLKIYTINRITSSKKLEINLTIDGVDEIILRDDSVLESMNRLSFKTLDFTAYNNASYKLDMDADDATFVLNKSTNGELLMRGNKAKMILNENAYLDAEMQMEYLDVEINKRADINLAGDVTNLKITATGSTDIKAKKLKSVFADLIASNTSDIYVFASKELKLYAQGKSYVYVYGNPEIKVEGLNDKSQIIKK
ncbi:GIN domain-containing protein [Ulvibacter antarcticus]|uniref:Putative autotransporter adhesin-like protein n=1 Tax=Ulvibacter antarcticus TaxID=442714 RepID=A0A3L9YKS1_9FLAO|nr:DUF2807 domain-containing protein [Ulvibacter antarcticus]RMA58598.1 putative autotransporter adhesin-like protein [Ulvibacter antarcticus]